MKYHLNIIDGNVEIPKKLDVEYTDLNTAYHTLEAFVHSFDYEKDVCGRVIDQNGNDIDYCNSIINGRYGVYMDGECCYGDRNTLDEAIKVANHLYGKGYSDDIQIYDYKTEEYIEW